MGKKCSFFGKFGVLCVFVRSVLRFTLLPYYRRDYKNVSLSRFSSSKIHKNYTAHLPRPSPPRKQWGWLGMSDKSFEVCIIIILHCNLAVINLRVKKFMQTTQCILQYNKYFFISLWSGKKFKWIERLKNRDCSLVCNNKPFQDNTFRNAENL